MIRWIRKEDRNGREAGNREREERKNRTAGFGKQKEESRLT